MGGEAWPARRCSVAACFSAAREGESCCWGAGEQWQGGPGHQPDFLSFDKTAMVFPPYVYKKTHFLHNLVKYFKVLNQFFLKELSNFKRLFS